MGSLNYQQIFNYVDASGVIWATSVFSRICRCHAEQRHCR